MAYEDDIRIDETALDLEWLGQPSLMMKYCRIAADARRIMDEAKEKLDVIRAEIDASIRSNPDKYGLVKATEASVAAVILTEKEFQTANSNFIAARYEYDMALGAVRAVDQRKDALENLVRLHGQQYFAGPKAPLEISREWEGRKRAERVDSAIADEFDRKPIRRR